MTERPTPSTVHPKDDERPKIHPSSPDSPKKKAEKGEFGKTLRDVIEEEREANPIIPVAAHLSTDIDEPVNPADREKKRIKLEEEKQKKQEEEDKKHKEDVEKKAKEKKELLAKIGKILEEYKNRESDIPATHEYWALVNQARQV